MATEKTDTALIELLSARFGSGGEMDGVGHRISTQAISGVGASSVGVAGAVAIGVVNARSEATVAAQDNTIVLTGDAAIRADEAQKVDVYKRQLMGCAPWRWEILSRRKLALPKTWSAVSRKMTRG